jgi:hypothetical protein
MVKDWGYFSNPGNPYVCIVAKIFLFKGVANRNEFEHVG